MSDKNDRHIIIPAESPYRDPFDIKMGSLADLHEVVIWTKISNVQVKPNLAGMHGQQFTVQTARHIGEADTVFVTLQEAGQLHRFYLPAKVVDAMVAQRDSLTARLASKRGKEQAAERKRQGIVPFQPKSTERSAK